MQFLVYLSVLMVSISTVLLELHWLTSPAPQPKPAIQASAPPPPKVEGPSAALSPVYPKKAETVETTANAQQPPPAQPQAGNQSQPPQQKPQAETTGMGTRAENPTPPTTPPAQAGVQRASAVPPEATNNRCDIQACASTYRSFRASDCTYQPFDGGERRLCAKGPGAARSAARDPGSESAAIRRSNRDVEFRERESERRTRVLPTDDEDDAMDADEGERGEPRLFLFGGQRRRW